MRHRKPVLSHQERIFAERFAATGDRVYAAEKAGYAHPAQRAAQNLANPKIQKVVALEVSERTDRIAVKVLARWEQAVDDPKTPIKAITDIGKAVLAERRAGKAEVDEKEPHEMTSAEIQETINKLRREQAERARPVIEGEVVEVESPGEGGVFG